MTPTDDDATPTNDRDANDNDYATINNHNNYNPPIHNKETYVQDTHKL